MREIRNLKKWVEGYEELWTKKEDLEVLIEFQKTGEVSEEEVEKKLPKLLIIWKTLNSLTCFLKKETP